MTDFLSVLNTKASDVEKPKPAPAGTYLAQLIGMPTQVERKDNKILEFKLKLLAPQGDVDQDKLAEAPELSTWAPIKYSVFVNDMYPLKRFLTEVLGIDPGPESDSKTFSQMLSEAPGKQLMATVSHRPFVTNDGEAGMAADIKQVARA